VPFSNITNNVVFDESIDFLPNKRISNFTVFIIEYDEFNIEEETIIGKETLNADPIINGNNTFILMSNHGGTINVTMDVSIPEDLPNLHIEPIEAPIRKSKSQKQLDVEIEAPAKPQSPTFGTPERFRNENYSSDLAIALSPLVAPLNRLAEIFSWKDPKTTIIYSACLTLLYLYSRGIIIVFSGLLFVYTDIFIVKLRSSGFRKNSQNEYQASQYIQVEIWNFN
jgi:hypothetical protein